ncbi:MAG: tetratricopeptide repeat-containing sensor histidine kinase [Bacteroidetes bacterium]|nr:tetratricopeptide repeat-containing sensor histidine kinase [Bacteroidota bacterium]
MKRKIFLSGILVLALSHTVTSSNGQQSNSSPLIDSFNTVARTATSDTVKVACLQRIAFEYLLINMDSTRRYTTAGTSLARRMNSARWQARMMLMQAEIALRDNKFDSAISLNLEALKTFIKTGDARSEGKAYFNIAQVYSLLNTPQKEVFYYTKALEIFEREHLEQQAGSVYPNLGMRYWTVLKDTVKALEYMNRGIDLNLRIGEKTNAALGLRNLGIIYGDIDRYKEITYYKRSLALFIENNDVVNAIDVKINLAGAYINTRKYGTALETIRSIDISAPSFPDIFNPRILYMLGGLFYNMTEVETNQSEKYQMADSAIYYLNSALALNDSTQVDDYTASILDMLSSAYEVKGDYKNALKYYRQMKMLEDKTRNVSEAKNVSDLLKSREDKIAKQEIALQKREIKAAKLQRTFLISGILILILTTALIIRQSRFRKKANQQLSIRNQQLDEDNRIKARFFGILSHDLRAPIAKLATYLHLLKEMPSAMDEQTKKQHQQTIENAANNLLSVMEDLLLWSKGQMANFKPTIKSVQVLQLFDEVRKLVPEEINANIVFDAPGLLKMDTDENFLKTIMRNLTANALKAISNQPDGKVEWKAWEERGKQFLSVTDNGPGLTTEQVANLFSESSVTSSKGGLGLHIVRDFAQMLGQKIEVRSKVGEGTSFILSATTV